MVYATVSTWSGRCSATIPTTRTFYLQDDPQDGPAILWYGWLAAAAIVSAAVAVAVPRRWAERLWPAWAAWAVPLIIAALVLVYERRWFV